MISVTANVIVDRPADEVFDYLSNFEHNPTWQRGMRAARFTTDPPLRVGSRYDQEARFLGRPVRSTFVVEALEPGSSITICSVAGTFPITVTRSVSPRADGTTDVSAHVRGDPGRRFAFAGPLLRWLVERSVRSDYARLKRILEGDPEAARRPRHAASPRAAPRRPPRR